MFDQEVHPNVEPEQDVVKSIYTPNSNYQLPNVAVLGLQADLSAELLSALGSNSIGRTRGRIESRVGLDLTPRSPHFEAMTRCVQAQAGSSFN